MPGLFSRVLNIHGWERLEVPLLAALACRQPVLLSAGHGVAKTEGLTRLLHAALGPSAAVAVWNAKSVRPRHMLGLLNPARLSEGRQEFIETPLSIWGKKGLVLDEMLSANVEAQYELGELIRTRCIQGLETDLEYVLAATNPPGGIYDVHYGNVVVIDRFLVLQPPAATQDDFRRVMLDSDAPSSYRIAINKLIRKARETMNPAKWGDVVLRVYQLCETLGMPLSVRKAKTLVQLLAACEQLGAGGKLSWTPEIAAKMTLGCIPSATGLTRTRADLSKTRELVSLYAQVLNPKPASSAKRVLSNKDNLLPDEWLAQVQESARSMPLSTAKRGLAKLTSNPPSNTTSATVQAARHFLAARVAELVKQHHGSESVETLKSL